MNARIENAQAQQKFGQVVEATAEKFLRDKGYKILERNVRSAAGEIDLIVTTQGVLVFVEVKGRRTSRYGGASWAISQKKQDRLVRLAAGYLARHQLRNLSCRFDVILYHGGDNHSESIEHIENAFEVSGDDLRW